MSRDALIVLGICVVAIAAGIWLYFGGSAASHSTGYTVLAQGDTAQVSDRVNYLITSGTELAQVWQMAYGGNTAPPAVDFTQNEVLAVFDGEHPSGGYGISVSGVSDASSTRTVTIVHSIPGTTCSVTEGETSPFEFVIVPKTSASLTHTDQNALQNCS